MTHSFNGKVYIVTGASRGIGFATAKRLVEAGARVALLARGADAVVEAAASLGEAAVGIGVDVGERDSMLAAFDRTVATFGRLDGVVNNAGATMVCRIENLSEAAVMGQINANFLGVVYGSQFAIPHLRRVGGGRIVNVTSATARHPEEFPYLSIYAATKMAAERFTFELREEVKEDNIGVTCFSPGTADHGVRCGRQRGGGSGRLPAMAQYGAGRRWNDDRRYGGAGDRQLPHPARWGGVRLRRAAAKPADAQGYADLTRAINACR